VGPTAAELDLGARAPAPCCPSAAASTTAWGGPGPAWRARGRARSGPALSRTWSWRPTSRRGTGIILRGLDACPVPYSRIRPQKRLRPQTEPAAPMVMPRRSRSPS
jgi:hypothetical protein